MSKQSEKPVPPLPTQRQLAWHKQERNIFCHFGPNTFTGEEWGKGTERPEIFNPKRLNCHQWVRAFKAAGFSGVVITAKHHDGFCLWPSKYSKHTVAQSAWRQGHGDVLKDLSEACKEEGLNFGVYLSPWDRNHPAYGTPEYNQVFKNMLREVLTRYGTVSEVWFDGANGEGPNGKKQVYDWPGFVQVVRECQPNAVIFSDSGPDIRWVGNEDGYAGETNWGMIDRSKFSPGVADTKVLNTGDEKGPDWVPGECDVSIRPGWFWRTSEDSKVKSVQQLLDIWYGSVGRGSNLLLNVPPNSDGLISKVDVDRLIEFNQALHDELSNKTAFWHPAMKGKAGTNRGVIELKFSKEQTFDRVWLSENIEHGQKVKYWRLSVPDRASAAQRRDFASGTTIGVRRLIRLDHPITASSVTLWIDDGRGDPDISEVRFYLSKRK